ncbi:hypothetical protein SAMN05216184_110115 [Georgenia satyanarayanai]|uniref:Uncharacterized protein n=1 Tax=Georgenia satyanarayanai TaxID=860221 RepID=A0A2Y9AJY6_9MICO|nr:hypothetical protein A8987_110115 [Georgenia satyanarayanai]SSA44824.1 hypothetical protein SAMN05216184_110115 [Georgenia satyanarayanai]
MGAQRADFRTPTTAITVRWVGTRSQKQRPRFWTTGSNGSRCHFTRLVTTGVQRGTTYCEHSVTWVPRFRSTRRMRRSIGCTKHGGPAILSSGTGRPEVADRSPKPPSACARSGPWQRPPARGRREYQGCELHARPRRHTGASGRLRSRIRPGGCSSHEHPVGASSRAPPLAARRPVVRFSSHRRGKWYRYRPGTARHPGAQPRSQHQIVGPPRSPPQRVHYPAGVNAGDTNRRAVRMSAGRPLRTATSLVGDTGIEPDTCSSLTCIFAASGTSVGPWWAYVSDRYRARSRRTGVPTHSVR